MAQKVMIPKEGQSRDKPGLNRKLIALICVIIICIVALSAIFILNLPKDDANAAISRVEINPESPQSGDVITISAYLDGNLSIKKPQFNYNTLFYSGNQPGGGTHPMTRISGNEYETTIGPYNEGVQIWYMIFLPSSEGISYNESTIDIGNVEYSDDVWIFDVDYSPKNLENCEIIEITAKFGHEGIITQQITTVELYHVFSPDGRSHSASMTDDGTYYSYEIGYYKGLPPSPDETPEYEPFPSNSLVFYRLALVGEGYKYATPSYVITIP